MKHARLEHKFVHYIPERLDPGVLYISMDFTTAAHSCCCGCGEQVVTPFTPHDWQMTFDGETVSIWPSIGNWDYACRSHYVIKRSLVIEAGSWSDEEIAAGRRKDKAAKEKVYAQANRTQPRRAPAPISQHRSSRQGLLSRIKNWLGQRKP